MTLQKKTFSWKRKGTNSSDTCNTLEPEKDSLLRSDKDICFSLDERFSKNTEEANPLQKKIGEKLKNLSYDRRPIIGKVLFNKDGITIYNTKLKDIEIATASAQIAISEIFLEENIEIEFVNGH